MGALRTGSVGSETFAIAGLLAKGHSVSTRPNRANGSISLNESKPQGVDVDDPLPLTVRQSPLWRWATPALSVAILAVVVWQFSRLDLSQVLGVVPRNPLFWAVLLVIYVTPVATDFAIFRRLWRIPLEGFVALMRKAVSNELLFGYLGEVYFYSWARKKLDMATSPFGAVKDVAILSALVGNACTLAMMAVAYPLVGRLNLNLATETLLLSIAIVILISMLAIVFGRRLFSLAKAQLWMVAGWHFVRIVVTTGLTAVAWSIALPQVALGWWVLLSTMRLLLSRLPLVANKDVLFAGIAVFLVGRDAEISALMALMASIILVMHLLVGAALAVGDFVTVKQSKG